MDFIKKVKELIGSSNLSGALAEMESFLDKDDELHNECILLQARLSVLSKNNDKNILSNSEYTIELNKINQSALYLLNKIFIYNQKISHSDFLVDLLLKLDSVQSPIQNDIQATISKIGSNVTDKEVLDTLLGVLPYPLGIRLRQIVADSWDKRQAEKYYNELLYDYAFLFETQLNYTLMLLLSQLWQLLSERNQQHDLSPVDLEKFDIVREFLSRNQVTMPLADYKHAIKNVIDITRSLQAVDVIPDLVNSAEKCVEYLESESFSLAASFFDARKKEFWDAGKIFMTDDSIWEYCERSKKYILDSFGYFSFVIQHALFIVQGVDVVNFRHTEKELKFNNSYSILLESHFGKKGANIEKSILPMENKSVLCFNNTERQGKSLNLFPFLINRNAFSKKSTENDLYQFIGFFRDDWVDKRARKTIDYDCFYFISLRKPRNIWRFDVNRYYNNDLTHIDEIPGLGDSEMYNTRELKEYLDSFLSNLMPSV